MRLSIKNKLPLVFTGLMAVLLLSVNLIMYSMSSGFRNQNFFRSMEDRARITAIAHKNQNFQGVLEEIKEHHIHRIDEAEDFILEIDEGRNPDEIALPEQLPLEAGFFRKIFEEGSAWAFIDGKSYAGILFEGGNNGKDLLIITAAVDVTGNNYRKKLRFSLAIAFLVALITMGITSWVFSRQLFDPVVRIIQKINNINAFNLNTRLEREGSSEEISGLKDTVNEMLERIEAAFKAQQRFVGNTTHSLRTPLTIIVGEAEIAMSKLDTDHKAYFSLEMIIEETEKLKNIISNLFELAKSGTVKEKNDWKVIGVDELVRSIYQAVSKMDHSYKLEVDDHLPRDSALLYIHGNEHLLNLAISNAILNGFKYSGNKEVSIKVLRDGHNVVIKVVDKGIGIPKNEVDQIFIPYFRASNAQEYEGFGIGLPLAMDIIRMHSGNIQIRSEEGMGTEVSFILSLVELYHQNGQIEEQNL